VISLEGVASRRGGLARANLSLDWDAGMHAVVGGTPDGAPELLAILAGLERPRTGSVRVLDGDPSDAQVRRAIALVPATPALPDRMTVRETLELATSIRGDAAAPPATDRLATLGVEALASRRVLGLSLEEARAVALVEALTAPSVRVILVEEPRVAVDPRAAVLLSERLRARAAAGCAVVLTTASMRDAATLGDDHLFLTATRPPAMARLRIVTRDPAALVSAIAREPAVEGVSRQDVPRSGNGAASTATVSALGVVVARGPDASALANAVGRAVVASGADVVEMQQDFTPGARDVTP
jgi:ABC-2 type transport system ATP-binding protein